MQSQTNSHLDAKKVDTEPEHQITEEQPEETKPMKREPDFDYYSGVDDPKKKIDPSTRAKIQLSW
jgi:hypothetical protein